MVLYGLVVDMDAARREVINGDRAAHNTSVRRSPAGRRRTMNVEWVTEEKEEVGTQDGEESKGSSWFGSSQSGSNVAKSMWTGTVKAIDHLGISRVANEVYGGQSFQPSASPELGIQPLDTWTRVIEGTLITCTLGLWCFMGAYRVGPNESVVIVHNGRLTGVESRPGAHWAPAFFGERATVSRQDKQHELKELKVVDSGGNPILISAVLVYRVVDAVKAGLGVTNYNTFVFAQAQAALKQVACTYTYDQLRVEAEEVSKKTTELLQSRVQSAGVEIDSMRLNELNYAPEIANSMLRKQQAFALVEARELVVDGAVQISVDAVTKLQEKGIELDDEERVRLVTNLLTVVCGDDTAKPTINVGAPSADSKRAVVRGRGGGRGAGR